jgi:hypothetical protein
MIRTCFLIRKETLEKCSILLKVKSKIPDFEPVEAKRRSRLSGTPRLSKRGHFSMVSKIIEDGCGCVK